MHCNKTHSNNNKNTFIFLFLVILTYIFMPNAAKAALVLSPATLDYGPVAVNAHRTLTVIVTNTDVSDDLSSIGAAISGNGPFTITNNCTNVTLFFNDSCSIQVTFSPLATGAISDALIVAALVNNDTTTTSSSILLGDGIDQADLEHLLLSYAVDNPSVRSTANVISEVCTNGLAGYNLQMDCDALILAAASGDAGTTRALLEITPERAIKASGLAQQGAQTQVSNSASRTLALRNGASGFSVEGLALNINGKTLAGDHLLSLINADDTGGAAGSGQSLFGARWGGFITGTIVSGDKDASSLESGLDFDTKGIMVGIDYRFNDQFVFGGALGYTSTDTDLDNDGGELEADGYSLTAYGTYYTEQNYFIDFSITYGINDYDQQRHISYQLQNQGIIDQFANASYHGEMLSLFVGSGYNFNYGSWMLGPRLSLEYIDTKIDDFTEKMSDPTGSGAGWATHIDDTDQQWLTLKLGGKVSYAHSTSWGVLTPFVGVDWLHEFKDDSQVINGNFVQDAANLNFSIFTESADRDYFQLTVGVSAVLPGGIIGYLNYDTILLNDLWSKNTISAGMRMEF